MIKPGQVWIWPRSNVAVLEYHIIKKIDKKGIHHKYYSPDFGVKKCNILSAKSEFIMEIKMYCKLDIAKTMKRMERIENKRG